MWQAGEKPKAIALAVGIHHTSVAKRAAKMNMPKPEPEGTLGPRAKHIDRARFTQMWNAGAGMSQIMAVFDLGENAIRARVDAFGLERRPVGGLRKMVKGGNSKPKADPKPVAEPKYHPGLSDAIKRAKLAGDPVARLGKVAATYRVPYREVLDMAGMQP